MKTLLTAVLVASFASITMADSPWNYPDTPREDLVETLQGVEVADPYRWLEDVDSEQTAAWVAAQNKVSDAYFEQLDCRDKIQRRLEELWDFDKFSIPRKVGDRLFFTKKSGLQNQGVLYWKEDRPDAEPQLLLDPNTLSEDGTIALSSWTLSEDGKLMAYGLSEGGSDWTYWKVRDVETGEDLEDRLDWVKFSGASWDRKGEGFYYGRYPETKEGEELEAINLNQKLYYHKIGTPQSEDRVVYERPDHPKWRFDGWVTEDSRYLTVSVRETTGDKNAFYYRDLEDAESEFVELIPELTHSYGILGNDGTVFYFRTNLDAPNYRVIAIDVAKPDAAPREIIPQAEQLLDDVSLLGDHFYASYLVDAQTAVRKFALDGTPEGEIELPGVGSLWGFSGRRETTDTFYYFTSYTVPGTIYRYDLAAGETSVFEAPEVDFNSEDFETRQVFFTSKDGTKVPMFITCRKDIELNGQNATYLYGYGGFNISLTPAYQTSIATWLEMGGVFVVANLRGGGEYGQAWHEAGTKNRKQNVFDDFQAAAEHLISEGYTSSPKLAIGGGSNGGLLVAACINQRPDLYAAAIAQVGVLDMLRYHKFTIGWAWVSDYGDPDNAEEFPALYAYSPYHNTRTDKPYPATLITTADHDDRVFPAHSFKFGAALQEAQTGDEPILLRIETKAGHGAGKPTSKSIEEIVDKWSFLAHELQMDLDDWNP